ncbi:hypothetical protein ACN28G_24700 [Micromonospora sp. WMMA1923]|uniref:hypothetical protein n=1 Tax=Micromonospora sp. WMMA1923 TaxID=3404125 RepID=UPI003B94279C
MTSEITTGGLLLAEYAQIKEEQRNRIGFRDNLIYATLASMAAVVAAVLSSQDRANLLLLLPAVTVVLGWTYLVNDEKISAIGRYVRTDLGPRLVALTPDGQPAFGWEVAHRSDPRRSSRKYLQLAVDLGTFVLPPLAALVVYWVNGPYDVAFVTVSLAELGTVGVLAWQLVRYADLATGPTT